MAAEPRPEESKAVVSIEDGAMNVEAVVSQVQRIQEVMNKVMKPDEHYGVIPGTKKPTLLKPGAEKLLLTFHLDPQFEIIQQIQQKNFLSYASKCTLYHIPTGKRIASGTGSCNSYEDKYRFRWESEKRPLSGAYWAAKKAGDSKKMAEFVGPDERTKKIDGAWYVLGNRHRVENNNPWALDNTIRKMADKRALVAAILMGTAASDIFTQDLEDMDLPGVKKPAAGKKGNGKGKGKGQEPPPAPAPGEESQEGAGKTLEMILKEIDEIWAKVTGMENINWIENRMKENGGLYQDKKAIALFRKLKNKWLKDNPGKATEPPDDDQEAQDAAAGNQAGGFADGVDVGQEPPQEPAGAPDGN